MKYSILKKSAPLLASVLLVACGGSSSSSSSGGTSTADIAGLWELPDDSVLGFEIVEISSNGILTNWSEDSFDNCYDTYSGKLVNEGNNNYGYIPPTSSEVVISYTLVNESDSLRYTSSFLNVDESWPALEGVSTSDFNICP